MDEDVIRALTGVLAVLLVGLTFLIPVAAFTLRSAIRPILETWIQVRQGQTSGSDAAALGKQVELLEVEVQQMQRTIQSIQDAQDFQQELGAPVRHNSAGTNLAAPAERSADLG